MGFTETISYWYRTPKDGERPPSSEDVFKAIESRVKLQQFAGQPEHVQEMCKQAGLSADQMKGLIELFSAGSRTINTNIRREYLQTVTVLNALLSEPAVPRMETLAA